MKKIILFLVVVFLLSGCGKYNDNDLLKELNSKIEDSKNYQITATLDIYRNEEKYSYDVVSTYKKGDYFKVQLVNKENNHEQIILKDEESVYVLTPALNKSFKFQSEWPYNNSQAYLLQTVLKDIEKDEERVFEENENGYIFMTKVNYSSNNNLTKQKVFLDKDLNFKEVIITNENDEVQMKMTFNSIDYKATYDDTYFTLKGNMSNVETKNTSKTLDSVVYPMYIPENTKLSSQEKVSTENGERIILTFTGDSSFMIIQETATAAEELLTIPMYGEPYIVTGTVGALSDGSVTWSSNGVEFYVVSDTLSNEQLLEVANSINATTVSK